MFLLVLKNFWKFSKKVKNLLLEDLMLDQMRKQQKERKNFEAHQSSSSVNPIQLCLKCCGRDPAELLFHAAHLPC